MAPTPVPPTVNTAVTSWRATSRSTALCTTPSWDLLALSQGPAGVFDRVGDDICRRRVVADGDERGSGHPSPVSRLVTVV
ncbi:MAG: hypothetical protein ABEI98_01185 [Halorhabdus sp.]